VVPGVVEPLGERGLAAPQVDLADGALEPGLLQEGEVLRLDQLDAGAAEAPGDQGLRIDFALEEVAL